jgi:hypothetical protein
MSSTSTPLPKKTNHTTPKIKQNMDELVHFVQKLKQDENKLPNLPTTTINNKLKKNDAQNNKIFTGNSSIATESPSVIVNINPTDYLERINRRKMIFAERHTNDNTLLKAQVKKKDLEIQRRKSENKELKEKLKSFAERHDEENKILEQSYQSNKEKSVGSPIVIAGEIENIFEHNNEMKAAVNKHSKIKGSFNKKGKSKSSFLGLNCCGGER